MSNNISLKEYIENKYKLYLSPITDLSCNEQKKFIKDQRKLYNFDKMICEFYNETCKPKSADALYMLDDNTILFVEFKTGYKDKVCIRSIDENKYCKNCSDNTLHTICNEKFKWFLKHKDLTKEDMKKAIFLKVAESYIIFKEKFIQDYATRCSNNIINYKFIFWLVIDAPVDSFPNSYKKNNDVSSNDINNIFQDMQKSIKRFYDRQNSSYYSEILVLNKHQFISKINDILN